MASDADCVIVTRFNLPSPGAESLIRAQDGWLRNRLVLFERYCLPSVRSQTNRSAHWIIYFDPLSPDWLLDRTRPYANAGVFDALYREAVTSAELVEDIQALLGACRSAELITINLDNDDALAIDFVERTLRVDVGAGGAAIYFEDGLIRDAARLYLRRDRTNAFRSVRESWDAPRTCWADWHNLLGRHMPVRVIDGPPAWLQVVHSQNVSNRVRGRRVAPLPYRPLFPGALDDLTAPRRGQQAHDLLIARPIRNVKETARASVKRVAMGILGKEGWDKAKHAWRSLRPRR